MLVIIKLLLISILSQGFRRVGGQAHLCLRITSGNTVNISLNFTLAFVYTSTLKHMHDSKRSKEVFVNMPQKMYNLALGLLCT